MEERIDRWINGQMRGWMYRCMEGWMDEWVDKKMDGWINRKLGRLMNVRVQCLSDWKDILMLDNRQIHRYILRYVHR